MENGCFSLPVIISTAENNLTDLRAGTQDTHIIEKECAKIKSNEPLLVMHAFNRFVKPFS